MPDKMIKIHKDLEESFKNTKMNKERNEQKKWAKEMEEFEGSATTQLMVQINLAIKNFF